jgi:hypothetical protein
MKHLTRIGLASVVLAGGIALPVPSRAADEGGLKQVGWATSLLEAEKLAKQHNRPVFLFTHDGRMGNGRC